MNINECVIIHPSAYSERCIICDESFCKNRMEREFICQDCKERLIDILYNKENKNDR